MLLQNFELCINIAALLAAARHHCEPVLFNIITSEVLPLCPSASVSS